MDTKMQGRKHVSYTECVWYKEGVSSGFSGHHTLEGERAGGTKAAHDFLALVCNPKVKLHILNWIQLLCRILVTQKRSLWGLCGFRVLAPGAAERKGVGAGAVSVPFCALLKAICCLLALGSIVSLHSSRDSNRQSAQ